MGAIPLTLAATAVVGAENGVKAQLQEVEQNLRASQEKRTDLDRAAQSAEQELRRVKTRSVEIARRFYALTDKADRLERRLKSLVIQESNKSAAMAQKRDQMATTLAALQRIARVPAAALLTAPQTSDDTIRSAILLRAVLPRLREEAETLTAELRFVTALRREISGEKKVLATSLSGLKNQRQKLAALTSDRLRLLELTQNNELVAAKEAAGLSAQAKDLRELIARLSSQNRPAIVPKLPARRPLTPPPPELKRQPSKIVALPPVTLLRDGLPVQGHVVTKFGDALGNGTHTRGIIIETRPSAPVVAPRAGRIVFAGQFRGYGNLVILELPRKGHALVAGMSTISAEIGDKVLAGEPLGEMTPSTSVVPKLYFELRRRGQPINPLPRNTAPRNKVRG
jgi:septal ring factor EnvC (AmiA/AmiB activator)